MHGSNRYLPYMRPSNLGRRGLALSCPAPTHAPVSACYADHRQFARQPPTMQAHRIGTASCERQNDASARRIDQLRPEFWVGSRPPGVTPIAPESRCPMLNTFRRNAIVAALGVAASFAAFALTQAELTAALTAPGANLTAVISAARASTTAADMGAALQAAGVAAGSIDGILQAAGVPVADRQAAAAAFVAALPAASQQAAANAIALSVPPGQRAGYSATIAASTGVTVTVGLPPGQGGTPPGQGGTPPGQAGGTPPPFAGGAGGGGGGGGGPASPA